MPRKAKKIHEAEKASETIEAERWPHEGHHHITIIFLIAVIITIVFFIPPAIVPIPQVKLPAQPHEPQSNVSAPETAPAPVQIIDYESLFIRNSFSVNRQHNFGLFETKLSRIGFYTSYNAVSNQNETRFRADIWVKNAGQAKEDFNTFNGFVRQPPNKYNVTGGVFDGEEVSPGEERSGYILFEDVPDDLKGDISLSIGTSLTYSSIFGIQSQFPFLYELTYPGK